MMVLDKDHSDTRSHDHGKTLHSSQDVKGKRWISSCDPHEDYVEDVLVLALGMGGRTHGSKNFQGSLRTPSETSCAHVRKQGSELVDLELGLHTGSGHEIRESNNVRPMSQRELECGATVLPRPTWDYAGAETQHDDTRVYGTSEGLRGNIVEHSDALHGETNVVFLSEKDLYSMPIINDDPGEGHLEILYNELIPLVDEGSTSARCMKSGGYMPSILYSCASTSNQNGLLSRAIWNSKNSKNYADISTSKQSNIHFAPDTDAPSSFSGHHSQVTSSFAQETGVSKRSLKTCKFKGCGKGARGASGLCIAHGGGQRCQKPNCNKGAEGRTLYCKAHGGGRRCQSLGCIKSAEGKTDFCIAHGGGRRCSHEGCGKAARGRSSLCIRHGGGKRCQREGCSKSAEGFSCLCISHGGGRRCQYPDCGKGAQGSTKFCKAHGGGKRCVFEGCMRGAEGSTFFCKAHGGGKRCTYGGGTCTKSVHGGTFFCVAHGGGKRCAMTGCTKSARGSTDCCVRHGGGKRCKFLNCGKSAQGNTDFCKAHASGKRCCWNEEGSAYSSRILMSASLECLQGTCEGLPRSKSGLCNAHNALVQQLGGGCFSQPSSNLSEQTFGFTDIDSYRNLPSHLTEGQQLSQSNLGRRGYHSQESSSEHDEDLEAVPLYVAAQMETSSSQGHCQPTSLLLHDPDPVPDDTHSVFGPEERVHGGGLMALLQAGLQGQSDK